MKKIIVTKKGYKGVTFIQVVDGVVGFICNDISQTLTTEEANRIYKAYTSNGWTAKLIPEKPSMAPQEKTKPVKKPAQTYEEAMSAKYGDKETRRKYIKDRNFRESLAHSYARETLAKEAEEKGRIPYAEYKVRFAELCKEFKDNYIIEQ